MGSKHGKQAAGLFNCSMLANEVDFNIQHKSIREEIWSPDRERERENEVKTWEESFIFCNVISFGQQP
jgi:hypothetical protein